MKAFVVRSPGGLDRLEIAERPDPGAPGPGEIRVAIHATSLNYHDLLVASGRSPAADGRVLSYAGALLETMDAGMAEHPNVFIMGQGVDDFKVGADRPRTDGVDLDSDDVVPAKEEAATVFPILLGQDKTTIEV